MEHKIAYRLGKSGKPFEEKLIDPVFTNKIELIENGKVVKVYNSVNDILTERGIENKRRGHLITAINLGIKFKGSLYRVTGRKSKTLTDKPIYVKGKDDSIIKVTDSEDVKFHIGYPSIRRIRGRLTTDVNKRADIVYIDKSEKFVSFNLRMLNKTYNQLVKEHLLKFVMKVTYHNSNKTEIIYGKNMNELWKQLDIGRPCSKIVRSLKDNRKHFMRNNKITLELVDGNESQ